MLPRCSTVGDVSIASPLDPTVSWAASFLRRSRLRHWQPLDYRSRNAASEGWGHDEVRRIIRSSGYLYSSAPDVDGGGQLSWKATSAWQWLAGRPAARPRACLHEQNVGGNPERRTTTQRDPAHAPTRRLLQRLAAGGSVWGVGGPLKERGIPPRDPQAKRGVSAGIFGGRDGTEPRGVESPAFDWTDRGAGLASDRGVFFSFRSHVRGLEPTRQGSTREFSGTSSHPEPTRAAPKASIISAGFVMISSYCPPCQVGRELALFT